MRYCGECGSSLGVEAVYTLRCPSCGASVESNSSLDGLEDPELLDKPTRSSLGYPGAGAPLEAGGHLPRQSTSRSRRVLWALGLLAAVLLVLAGGTALALSHLEKGATTTPLTASGIRVSESGSSSGRTPQSSGGSSTKGSGSGVPPATANPSQTSAATQSPIVGSSPTVGATPAGTVSVGPVPTSTPTAAYLSVYPTSFSSLACVNLGALATFTISNSGGSPLDWTASKSVESYSVSPSSGRIDAGLSEQVSVNGILFSGTVTISAPGAENSPVQVHINCLL